MSWQQVCSVTYALELQTSPRICRAVMDSLHSFAGALELIVGPMFSGKSTELLRRVRRHRFARRSTLLVKYSVSGIQISPLCVRLTEQSPFAERHPILRGLCCNTRQSYGNERQCAAP